MSNHNFNIKKSEDDKMRVFGWGQVAVRKDGTVHFFISKVMLLEYLYRNWSVGCHVVFPVAAVIVKVMKKTCHRPKFFISR